MWDFSLNNFDSVWAIAVQFLLLLGFLVLGNMLRRSIPFLRKSFIPSALIGGVLLALIGLLVKAISPDFYPHFIDMTNLDEDEVTFDALEIIHSELGD